MINSEHNQDTAHNARQSYLESVEDFSQGFLDVQENKKPRSFFYITTNYDCSVSHISK